jgi:hypothetical protein
VRRETELEIRHGSFPPQPHARLVAIGELDAGGVEGGADGVDCAF